MKLLLKPLAVLLCSILINTNTIKAQCPVGETEVTIDFSYIPFAYNYGPLIQWDYIAGGVISGNGPYNEDDVITACIPDGDLIIVGCEGDAGVGWFLSDFTVVITEDGSVNGCGTQDGCFLFDSFDINAFPPIVDPCSAGPGSPTSPMAQLVVGPCDASPVLTIGCTNPLAPNYNACATADDGFCLIPTPNNNCADAIPLTVEPEGSCSGYFPGNSTFVFHAANTLDYVPSCGMVSPVEAMVDLFYTFTVPPTGSIMVTANTGGGNYGFPDGGSLPQATILDACNGTEYFCGSISFSATIANLPPGEEVIFQIWQSVAGSSFYFCVEGAETTQINDLCENAIPICGNTNGNNQNATMGINDPFTECAPTLENTVWYSFQADGSGNPIMLELTQSNCTSYLDTLNEVQPHILSGICGGPFTVEDCIPTTNDTNGTYTLNLPNPVVGASYFLYVDGSGGRGCDFLIEPSGGIQLCCGPVFSLNAVCQLGEDTGFTVDIEVTDIGDNSSGYSINGGAYPDITATGTVTIGPFPNGTATITLEGLDDASCVITNEVELDCSCDPLAVTVSEDGLICAGDTFEATATLEDVIPGGFTGNYTVTTDPAGSCTVTPTGEVTEVTLGDDASTNILFGFSFSFWENTYTDFFINSNGFVSFGVGSTDFFGEPIPSPYDPNNLIALFWTDLSPQGNGIDLISYFNATVGGQNCMVVEFDNVAHYPGPGYSTITGQIIMCEDGTIIINCIDCQSSDYNGYYYYGGSATSGIENSDGTAGFFDPNLTNGQNLNNLNYTACTTFTPEFTEPTSCNFLYWVTDLNDPAGSVVSTDETATFNPIVTTTYYAVVECENNIQCIDEVTVTIDDPANCGEPPICQDEIAGQIIAPFECDLSGITVVISIVNDDGTETIIGSTTTDASGNYTLPNSANMNLWACDDYSAMLMLPLPDCYADAGGNPGPVGPIAFTVDGDGEADGAVFAVNPEVPTLSQWGLIVLALLMMTFGALKLAPKLSPNLKFNLI